MTDNGSSGTLSPKEFEAQMRWLRDESGLTVVSLGEAAIRLVGGAVEDTIIVLTFDDGYLGTLTSVAPVLARYRMPFTVFVVGGFLDTPPVHGGYLDRGALRELSKVPDVLIGVHGQTHRPLTRLGDAVVAEELKRSADIVTEIIGTRPTAMSYPHGAVDSRVERMTAEAGFRLGATSLIGVNRPGVPLLRLRRTEVNADDSLANFIGKVRGDYDWYQIKQRLYWPVPAA